MLRFQHEPEISDPVRFLDEIASKIEQDVSVTTPMDMLLDGLWWIRKSISGANWRQFLSIAQGHRLRRLVHADPFTRRAFIKPRGYPGDAPLLDMIYYDLGFADLSGTDDFGTKIFHHTVNTAASRSVRERRDYVARAIDEVCQERNSASILCAACGHLREATVSQSIQRQSFSRFVAMDQDAASLAEVMKCYGNLGVEATHMKMRSLLGNKWPGKSFDLIYAAGLYDYLDDNFAQRLTTRLFDLLKPGGRLIVGNYVPWIYGVGYMETYMAWSLIYRDARDMVNLSEEIPESDVSLKRTYTLNTPDVIYLELRRRLRSAASQIELPTDVNERCATAS